MKDFSVPMALADYVPVTLFAIAAVILIRDLYNKMSKGAFALFAAGTIDVVCAGFLKATYKLLYALGVCDFEALSHVFFPMQSLGFLLAGIGMLALMTHAQKKKGAFAAAAPAAYSGTFVFVTLMVLGLELMDVGLCVLSFKLKKKWLCALFVVSFVFALMMGYLSSKDFTEAYMNWIAEFINIIGQGTLLAGVIMLHKNGLSDLVLREGEENV